MSYAPKPVTFTYVDTQSYQGIYDPQPLLVVGDSTGQAQGIQALSVGAMMQLDTSSPYSASSPFLRVRDSGTVQVLTTPPTNFTRTIHGHRYGRAVTVYVRQVATGAVTWAFDLGDNFFLGRPEVRTEQIVPVYTSGGTNIAGWLRCVIDPDNGVSYTALGTVTSGSYIDYSFSFVTGDSWPDNVPYNAPVATTVLDFTSPPPATLTISWDDYPDDPTIAGDEATWSVNLNHGPDGPVILHWVISGQEEVTVPMVADSVSHWSYSKNTYYDYPMMDYQDSVDAWVTASYLGVPYSSTVQSFELS